MLLIAQEGTMSAQTGAGVKGDGEGGRNNYGKSIGPFYEHRNIDPCRLAVLC